MKRTGKTHHAKSQLSALLDPVAQGEEIIIAKGGLPVAKLIPYHEPKKSRKPGAWSGKIRMARDFDELPKSVLATFEGKKP